MFGLFRRKNKMKLAKYQPCPMCGAKKWVAKGNGEVVERFGRAYIRRYHQCGQCGTRFNLVRLAYDDMWHFTTHAASIRA